MPTKTIHPSAFDFIPERPTIPKLWQAAQGCRACDLYKNATQAVLGIGPREAAAFFIGEQPGDQEDLAGKPFVGPAGKVLDEALVEAGIPRDEVFVTNAVKHFKWEPRGKRRIHDKPTMGEVKACRPWLETESRHRQAPGHRLPGSHCGPVADGTQVQDHGRAGQALRDSLGSLAHGDASSLGHPEDAG